MSKKRANFDLDDLIDIGLLEGHDKKSRNVNKEDLEKVAEDSGFIKRLPTKTKSRRRKSPYTDQLGIKTRPLIKDIFYEIGEKLSVYDHTTFELAVLALIEKQNDQDLINRYKKITENKNVL